MYNEEESSEFSQQLTTKAVRIWGKTHKADLRGGQMMNQTESVTHTFEPLFDKDCRVLLLGTMPSPKSREQGFYYGHPRNRFWKVLAELLGEGLPSTIEEKKAMALSHHIAIWDVLASCDIRGADDASIRNPVPNNMHVILDAASIQAVFATGQKAAQLYRRYCEQEAGMPVTALPSTSPANCGMKYETILEAYREILRYL